MRYSESLAFGFLFVLLAFVGFFVPGTGGDGDSILHYLYAKHAFDHPMNLLNHWAKPFFTLIASVFAQGGIEGMKLFNVLMASLTAFFTYRIGRELNFPFPMLPPVMLFLIPDYTILIFSGLTEPMFGCMLVAGVYLAFRERYVWSAIILSMLPFVRSEGLIIIGVFLIYLVIKRKYKSIAWLSCGHVAYGILGWPFYGSIFWIFNRIPYVGHEAYATGGPFDFVNKLYYFAGLPVFVLFCLGVLWYLALSWRNGKTGIRSPNETWLIFGMFAAYFTAHSVFWTFGLFHTMGLSRVLVAVSPLIALIAVRGLGVTAFITKPILRHSLIYVVIGLCVVFPFTNNPAAPKLADIQKTESQHALDAMSPEWSERVGSTTCFYWAPYIAESWHLDYFDESHRWDVEDIQEGRVSGYLIWDSWFAVVEGGQELDVLRSNELLEVVHTQFKSDSNEAIVVFKSID